MEYQIGIISELKWEKDMVIAAGGGISNEINACHYADDFFIKQPQFFESDRLSLYDTG